VPYTVEITDRAKRELRRLPKQIASSILFEARALAKDPRPHGYQKLSGTDLYRIRVGDYRIVYEIHDRVLVVLVIHVGHRREVYKRL
jgi:mRNA interferase RelE/StbE